MNVPHEFFGKTYAIRFHLMAPLINFAQVGFRVQMYAGLVSVMDHTSAKIDFLIAAFTALRANVLPVVRFHSSYRVGKKFALSVHYMPE